MKPGVLHRLALGGALVLASLLTSCSESGGLVAGGGDASVAGILTSERGAATHGGMSLAGGPGDDAASDVALAGVSVRLVDPSGGLVFDSRTDARGEFEITAPEGIYRLEVTLPGGDRFTFEVSLESGERLFVQARVQNGARALIDAEIFTDDDRDGISDSGFRVRIRGREAGRPGSGEVGEDRPDDDLEEEDADAADDAPAALGDLREGQRVFVKGAGSADGFEADEVHGNAGRADRFCRLSGFLTGVQEGPDGITAVEMFGVRIGLGSVDVAGVRGGRGPRSSLAEGVRVEVHARLDQSSGELHALRLHARGGRGDDPERILGRLTAEPDVAASLLEVCGIEVSVAAAARVTNGGGDGRGGDGRGGDERDDDGNDDDDDDDDDDEDDGGEGERVSFAEVVAALAGGGFNHDARGTFDASTGTLRLDELTLSTTPGSRVEIVAEVRDANAGAGTFRLLGLPVVVDAGTSFAGDAGGAAGLTNGRRVRAELVEQGGVLVARRIQPTGEPHDRLRGGALALLSAELAADPNVRVDLADGLSLTADADSATEFEIEG
ncbi:MAG: DUF5666 domain-containing protein [Gemmatimonadota bacterium]